MAAFDGKVDMAIGNAVGSVTANLALIMGIALVCLPSAIRRRDYLLKAVLMLGASLYLVLASSGGSLSFQSGIALLVIFVIAMWDNIRSALRSMREEQTAASRGGHPRPMGHEVRRNLLKFLLGRAGIVIGAQLLVDHGGNLARLIGVPERIIGVTLIAVGTSLPELVTTLTAIAKKQASCPAGNIIGANIIDLTLILPICSLISGWGPARLRSGPGHRPARLPAGGLHPVVPSWCRPVPALAGRRAAAQLRGLSGHYLLRRGLIILPRCVGRLCLEKRCSYVS